MKVIDPDLSSLKDIAGEGADETGFKILKPFLLISFRKIMSAVSIPYRSENKG